MPHTRPSLRISRSLRMDTLLPLPRRINLPLSWLSERSVQHERRIFTCGIYRWFMSWLHARLRRRQELPFLVAGIYRNGWQDITVFGGRTLPEYAIYC